MGSLQAKRDGGVDEPKEYTVVDEAKLGQRRLRNPARKFEALIVEDDSGPSVAWCVPLAIML